jgi:FKBP-type peptidyl-prolyl cis-trans isomerase
MLNRSLPISALILALAAPAALAQPAVPAVPPAPLPGRPVASAPPSASDLPPTSAPTTAPIPVTSAARPAPAPARADDPPTTDFAPAPVSRPAPVTASAAPRPGAVPAVGAAPPSASDAPPSSAPAASALDAAPTTIVQDAAAPTAASLQTVPRNFPLTPEGNAAFLANYRARPDVIALPGGVLYRALVTGKGTVSYRGWLIDGTTFDNSPPGVPRAFQIGALVEGWREALLKMKVGDLWEVVVPAALAYGAEGRAGRIPPNQTLIFVISVSKIEYAG